MTIGFDSDMVMVPRAFFEQYMEKLSFDQIKVYLYLVSGIGTSAKLADISNELKIPHFLVSASIKELSDMGLISVRVSDDIIEDVRVNRTPSAPDAPSDSSWRENILVTKAEQIKGKPLSSSETELVYYIKDELSFSDELLMYLLNLCRTRDAFSESYIRKVAISWHENGIDTVEKAKQTARRYGDIVYNALSHLGRNSVPTQAEADYIIRWGAEYGMSDELILYVCDLTSVNTDRNRLKYADCIIRAYHSAGVHDVEGAKKFNEKKPSLQKSKNSFGNFEHRGDIDFDELEKLLLDN